ncbi:GPI inositol-deacylase [Chrysoperla carnea]|uniref:GPI inositol-deacylase n=1 Tax=Chrysoperla carnea TaxID=189513 RepID=UPI001D06FECF|nr:GPI inositol-deacylase [Chrysoperla carnea]
MTYMYEWPDYTRIYLKENEKFPQYGLYAYSEGKYKYKYHELKFKGVPVLFIPGNGGSYQQVRSLASIALRKAIASYKFHFNFFTVDLNEELSGLYGGVLNAQAEFVNHSIYRILQLYSTRPPKEQPKTVILVGHSMGGIVSLKVMTNMKDAQNVDLIITMSAPHLRPPINLDPSTEKFYKDIKKVWEPRADYLLNKTVITVGSGFNDRLINTHLTQFESSSIHAITTGIPKAWVDTAHVVIVWCKQVIMAILRSLFDLIDPDTRQLIADDSIRKEVFHHYLVHNSGINLKYKGVYANVMPSSKIGDWIEINGEQTSFDSTNVSLRHVRWIMIPVSRDYLNKNIIIQARNLAETNWIFYCSAISVTFSKQICEKMYHLSQHSEIVPSVLEKRREINVDFKHIFNKFPEVTHLIVKIPADSKDVKIDVDIFDPVSRNLDVFVPGWYSIYNNLIFKSVPQGGIKYKINLHNFDHVYNAASLVVKSECNTSNYQIVATFKAPWSKQSTSGFFNVQNKKPIPLSVFSSKPPEFKYEYAYLEINLDSSCISEIRIKSNIIESLGQITRHYSIMLIANIGAVLILILRYQLLQDNCTSIINTTIIQATKPFYFLITVQLITELLNSNLFAHFIQTDVTILTKENMNFTLLPIVLYLGGIGCVFMLSFGLWIGIMLGGSTVQKLTLKVLCKRMFGFVRLSEWMLDCMQNFTFGIICALICLAKSLIKTSVISMIKKFKNKLFSKNQSVNDANKTDPSKNSTEMKAINNSKTCKKIENYENKNIAALSQVEDFTLVSKPANGYGIGTEITDQTNILKDDSKTDIEILELKDDDNETESVNNVIITSDNSLIQEEVENTAAICKQDNSIEVDEEESIKNIQEQSQELERVNKDCDRNESIFTPLHGLYFHLIVFMIFCEISAISIPSVLTWARNFKHSKVLVDDPSYIPTIIVFISAFYLWDIDIPKTNLKYKNFFGNILYMIAVFTVIYSTLTVYRLSYFLSITLLLVALYQRFAPIDEEIGDFIIVDNSDENNELMEKIKTEENEQSMMKSKLD